MSKVTILTAVYNAQDTLRKCLDSLIAQTLHDIQIVCIDDASADGSLAILRQYERQDSRVTVLPLDENHGQAYARNQGLAVADGEYITMLDSDDWLSADALEQAVATFESHPQTGCVLFDVRYVWGDGRSEGYQWHYPDSYGRRLAGGGFEVMTGYDAFRASLGWQIHGVYMAKASLYKKYPYDTSCRSYSDDNTTRLHYLASAEVRCCKGVYFYLQRSGSVSHDNGVGHMDWMRAADSLRRQLQDMRTSGTAIGEKISDEVMKTLEWERWKIIVDCYWHYFRHRRRLTAAGRHYCTHSIRYAWQGTDTALLQGQPIHRPGWYPFAGHWRLFVIEANIYFFLRSVMRRQ